MGGYFSAKTWLNCFIGAGMSGYFPAKTWLNCFIGAGMRGYFGVKIQLNCFIGAGLAVLLEASVKWILVYYSGKNGRIV